MGSWTLPEMSDEQKVHFIRTYARKGPGGRIYVRACPLCGLTEWVCTTEDATAESWTVSVESSFDCRRCYEVSMRAPEIFAWISGVASMLSLRLEALEKK